MSNKAIIIGSILLVLSPVIIIFGAIAIKLLWGFFPMLLCIVLSGLAVWHFGIAYFFLVALGIMLGIVATWLWQRTSLFLRVDRALEKGMMLGD